VIEIEKIIVYRCKKCGKVLFEGNFKGFIVKICPKCKEKNVIKNN